MDNFSAAFSCARGVPPERRAPVQFGLESPSGYLFLSSPHSARSAYVHGAKSLIDKKHLGLLLDPVDGKQFVHARLLPTDAHRFQESLSFLL
jgi:hypothetical protein